MAWKCKSCHRLIRLDPDPRGCDDEPLCWHCLYEQREVLLAACEATRRWLEDETLNDLDELSEDCKAVLEAVRSAIAAAKGQP